MKRGFSLIELLVVVAIIGILGVTGIGIIKSNASPSTATQEIFYPEPTNYLELKLQKGGE